MRILAVRTDGAWVQRALADVDEILVDHAHCEKKAASTALSLLFRYPERDELLVPLARLAQEELAHFAEVVEVLAARGVGLRHQVPSSYAGALLAAVRPTEPDRLVDTLLCAALIEARSCERMQLLADALTDDRLVTLYRGLLRAEARHHATYVKLASTITDPATVDARLSELARHEAAVLATATPHPRLHA
jgi:tRNA 2-(methylsulfanyl)-N6-isopentenyladenosine37 hydroxylase